MATALFQIKAMASNQAQKYVTFNEAMAMLDASLQLVVVNRTTTAPPGSPSEGDKYIPLATATGDWVGQENNIALFVNGEWIFLTPEEGWEIYDQALNSYYTYGGATWADQGSPPDVSVDGSLVLATPTDINFTGSAVSAVDDSDGTVTVTIGEMALQTDTTTAYAVVNADFDGQVVHEQDNAAANTVTLNTGLTNTEPFTILQKGAGQTTIVAGVGVTINSASGNLKLTGQFSSAALIPIGSEVYYLVGDLSA